MMSEKLEADEEVTAMAAMLKAAYLPHKVVFGGESVDGHPRILYTCWIEVPNDATPGGWIKIDAVVNLVRYMNNRLR